MDTHNLLMASSRRSDLAVLTANSAATGMPVTNLQRMQPRYAWRSLNPAATVLEIDMATAAAFNLVALLFTNATAAATWRIRAATSQANLTAAPGYDSGVLTIWPVGVPGLGLATWPWVDAIKFLAGASGPGAQTFRWWRIDIADAANPDGFFEAAQLILDVAVQFSHNLVYGWSVRPTDQSARLRAAGGQILPVAGGQGRILRYELRWGSEAEMYGAALDIDRLRGSSRPIFVIRDPDRPDLYPAQALYGLQGAPSDIVNHRHNLYAKGYEVELMTP